MSILLLSLLVVSYTEHEKVLNNAVVPVGGQTVFSMAGVMEDSFSEFNMFAQGIGSCTPKVLYKNSWRSDAIIECRDGLSVCYMNTKSNMFGSSSPFGAIPSDITIVNLSPCQLNLTSVSVKYKSSFAQRTYLLADTLGRLLFDDGRANFTIDDNGINRLIGVYVETSDSSCNLRMTLAAGGHESSSFRPHCWSGCDGFMDEEDIGEDVLKAVAATGQFTIVNVAGCAQYFDRITVTYEPKNVLTDSCGNVAAISGVCSGGAPPQYTPTGTTPTTSSSSSSGSDSHGGLIAGLVILYVLVLPLIGFLFMKIRSLEKRLASPGVGGEELLNNEISVQ